MTEATFMLSLVLFIAVIVGAIVTALPVIGRRGLLFGTYVGEDVSDGADARRLKRTWMIASLAACAAAALLGVLLVQGGHAVAGYLCTLTIFLVAYPLLYLWCHFAARRLGPAADEAPPPSAAPIAPEPSGAAVLPWVTLLLCLATGGAVLVDGLAHYDDMPDRVPIHFDGSGQPDGWADKSFASVLALPLSTLLMPPIVAVIALGMTRAKRAVRSGDGGRSLAAQLGFRQAVVRLLCVVAACTSGLMASLAVGATRVALGRASDLGPLPLVFGIATTVLTLGGVVWLAIRHGQGGSRTEGEAAEQPLTDGLADNRQWVLGVFYVNRDDPSVFVEKRFGLGYTVNFGNPKAIALLAGFFVVMAVIVIVSFLPVLDGA